MSESAGGQWVKVAELGEIPDEGVLGIETDDETPIVLIRTEGEVFALRDECSHGAVRLSEGEVEDGTLECFLHGSCFDLRSGAPLNPPATQPVPTYDVKIDGDDVLVSLDKKNS